MLIAQALAENVPIVSNDRALDGLRREPAVVNRARRLSSRPRILPLPLLIPALSVRYVDQEWSFPVTL